MAQALHETMEAVTDNADSYNHLLGIFTEWIGREKVALELTQMIDPGPDTEIDLNLLHREFEVLGYSSELLGEGVNFMELVMKLIQSFSSAAALLPELQEQIQIGYLRDISEGMNIQVQESIEQSRDMKRLAKRLAPDMTPRKRAYLDRIVNQCESMPLKGMDFKTVDASTDAGNRIKLADVYVALDTTTQVDDVEKYLKNGMVFRLSMETKVLSTLEALAFSKKMVLLGDPGGGKSTFVNHLSLCLSGHILNPYKGWLDRLPKWPEAMANLLPIPVVLRNLAAWVREKKPEQRKSSLLLAYLEYRLCDRDLDDFFPLLKDNLRSGEAILLLDGLDEAPVDEDLRGRIMECIVDLPIAFKCSLMLLTCRLLSYQDPVWRLASNPLLLTVMALIHTHKGEMPDARSLLYEDIVDLLLWRWEAIKLEKEDAKETTWRKLLSVVHTNLMTLKSAGIRSRIRGEALTPARGVPAPILKRPFSSRI